MCMVDYYRYSICCAYNSFCSLESDHISHLIRLIPTIYIRTVYVWHLQKLSSFSPPVQNHGFIHPQSLKLLDVQAAKAELTWCLPSKVIFEYWLKVLSVTLHRAMAYSIVWRARTLTSGIATPPSARRGNLLFLKMFGRTNVWMEAETRPMLPYCTYLHIYSR
jgi:hypothetical protein